MSSLLKDAWQYSDPINSPDGFVNNEEIIKIIKKSAENHLAAYPKLEVPYGDYYKLKMGDLEYPGTGGPQHLGVFRILYSLGSNPDEEGKFYGNFGDTFVLVLEMGEEINAKGLLTYGNSSNPDNKHYGDQLDMFSNNELRNIWFKRIDQETNLELRENKVE